MIRASPAMEVTTLTTRHCCCRHDDTQRSKRILSAPSARRTDGSPGCAATRRLVMCRSLSNVVRTSLCLLLTLFSLCTAEPAKYLPDTPRFEPSDMRTFQGRAANSPIKYYRYLAFSKNHDQLYVGAMNFFIQLDPRDISQSPKISNNITNSDVENNKYQCLDRGKSLEYECQNHIRAVMPREDGTLEACGTAAFSSMTFIFNENDITTPFVTGSKGAGARALCSRNPADSCTTLYVRNGNPGDRATTYSAAVMDFDQEDPVIFRPDLTPDSGLLRSDSQNTWLNHPVFVAMFEVGDYVYIFLRELAVEYTNCGKIIYSRIARICKNDRGGSSSVLQNHWTTFFKARLNCSIPGDFPFYFNELYDVYQTSDGMFYGVFTTNLNGMYGSAVCAFTGDSIQAAFDGPFKEQPGPNYNWIRVKDSQVPVPRPGQCTGDSRDTPDADLHFIKARPLMDESVHSQTGSPLFYQQEIIFNKIVVDQVERDNKVYNVFFLAADDGSINKIVTWMNSDLKVKSKTIAIWRDFAGGTIQQMKIYNDQLYLSTDEKVIQVPVQQCNNYEYCTQCIQDPHCGWDINWNICTKELQRAGVVQNVTAEFPEKVCGSSCMHAEVHNHSVQMQGDAVHFNCSSRCEPSGDVKWYYNGRAVQLDFKRYFLTSDSGLVVLNVTNDDNGGYECRSNGIVLTKHSLIVNGCTDVESCWRQEFVKWCQEFEIYKKEFSHWQCLKDQCTSKSGCIPQDYADECSP